MNFTLLFYYNENEMNWLAVGFNQYVRNIQL